MQRNRFTLSMLSLLAVGVGSPLLAQNAPAPSQSTPAQIQPAPTPTQPSSVPRAVPVPSPTRPPVATQAAQQPPAATPQAGTDPTPQASPAPTPPAAGMVSLNFSRADLVEIIHIIAQHLRLTYTIDPEVKGTVTINSAEPLRPEDLLPIFHQVLRMNDAVAVKTGNLYHIMPVNKGKGLARPAGTTREDSFALQIVPVRFFSVAEMKKVLTPFLRPGGEIIEYPRGNFLIIVDLPSSIQRLAEIADLVDVQVFAGTRMEIYQPKVASAEELAQEMTKVMQTFAASVPQADTFTAQFIPLPRINQLLVISHSEAAWTYARRWLERIDVIAEGPGRRIFIYPVENGKATELADVLSQALGIATTGARAPSQTLQSLHRSGPSGIGQQPGGRTPGTPSFGAPGFPTQQQQYQGGAGVPGAFATLPAPGQPVAPAPLPGPTVVPGAPRSPTQPAPAAKPEEQLRVVADPSTNSLIIYGTSQEFQNIRNILKELDAVPRQVLLDVLVAEVTLSDSDSLGIDYEIMRKGSGISVLGRTFGSQGSLLTGVLSSLGTAPATGNSQFPGGLSGVAGSSNSVRALINALQTDSRIKILSSPSILATDNRPARIQVGSEEPVATGTITGAVGTVASSTTIQYRNTGRIVTIIPQVNSQGLVNLQILAEVSQRGANVPIGAIGDSFPSFDTRQAETTAVVQDGDTLAIGGIIAENKTRDRSGIPYLMDLPVLGRFFGSTSDSVRKTELVMLITPHVIRNRDEARSVTQDFKEKLSTLRNELERMKRDQERERLKRQMQEQKPAVPQPPAKAPAPAPSSAPVMPPISPEPAKPIFIPAEPSLPVNPAMSPTTEPLREARTQVETPAVSSGSKSESVPQENVVPSKPVYPAGSALDQNKKPVMQIQPRIQAPVVISETTLEPAQVKESSPPQPVSHAALAENQSKEPVLEAKVRVEPPGAPLATATDFSRMDELVADDDLIGRVLTEIEASKSTISSAKEPVPPSRKTMQIWVVQVASYAYQKDAETHAQHLRDKGYDVNVVSVDVGSKTWHRVQVGELPSRREAVEMQKTLRASEKLEQAFVASR